ncbi:hypothetical protein GCM10011581_05900 [Saccharopolyspora subtropica]|uniref:Uncharacterized protein n=1 Tax=Saccharopolyspora thermophila TaxID=89367 RepID=A0A917N8R7_9PSEU|nr:hypothetical protein [Saccharopolyspora subtropica]GGI71710.1 hypothetical protein GCM10011581_05900 [Saccharopolyspora subtropica]
MTHKTYGLVNGQRTEFVAALRQSSETPAALQVAMVVPLSYEDIVAVFYVVIKGGAQLSELDADYARQVLFDTLLNDSADVIEEAQLTIEETEPGTDEYALIQAIRAKVAEVFAPVNAPAPRRVRGELVGVSR